MEERKLALLIDSDNVSVKYLNGIFDELAQYGIITYRRIYGDFTSHLNARWSERLLEKSIIPIQQFSNTTGKNATDSALIIDAMDLLYTSNVDGFCIVSSDSDFTRLASRLRESGKIVIGMGEKKTPDSFRAACTIFTELENLLEEEKTAGATNREAIEADIINIITQNDNRGKATGSGEIGSKLQNKYPDFDIRSFGYSQLSKFLEDMPALELRNENNTIMVSLREEKGEDPIIREIVELVKARGGHSITLATLGHEIRRRHRGFNVARYGYSQLYAFIDSIPELKVVGERTERRVMYAGPELAKPDAASANAVAPAPQLPTLTQRQMQANAQRSGQGGFSSQGAAGAQAKQQPGGANAQAQLKKNMEAQATQTAAGAQGKGASAKSGQGNAPGQSGETKSGQAELPMSGGTANSGQDDYPLKGGQTKNGQMDLPVSGGPTKSGQGAAPVQEVEGSLNANAAVQENVQAMKQSLEAADVTEAVLMEGENASTGSVEGAAAAGQTPQVGQRTGRRRGGRRRNRQNAQGQGTTNGGAFDEEAASTGELAGAAAEAAESTGEIAGAVAEAAESTGEIAGAVAEAAESTGEIAGAVAETAVEEKPFFTSSVTKVTTVRMGKMVPAADAKTTKVEEIHPAAKDSAVAEVKTAAEAAAPVVIPFVSTKVVVQEVSMKATREQAEKAAQEQANSVDAAAESGESKDGIEERVYENEEIRAVVPEGQEMVPEGREMAPEAGESGEPHLESGEPLHDAPEDQETRQEVTTLEETFAAIEAVEAIISTETVEVAEAVEAAEAIATMEVAEAANAVEVAEAVEAAGAVEGAEALAAMGTAEVTEVADELETAEAAEAIGATEAAEAAEAIGATEAAEATEAIIDTAAVEVTEAAEAVEDIAATEAAETAEAMESVEAFETNEEVAVLTPETDETEEEVIEYVVIWPYLDLGDVEEEEEAPEEPPKKRTNNRRKKNVKEEAKTAESLEAAAESAKEEPAAKASKTKSSTKAKKAEAEKGVEPAAKASKTKSSTKTKKAEATKEAELAAKASKTKSSTKTKKAEVAKEAEPAAIAEKAEPALELTQTEPTAKTNQEDAEPARKKRPYHRRKNTETAGEAPAAEGTSEPKKKRPYTRRKKSTAEEQPQA